MTLSEATFGIMLSVIMHFSPWYAECHYAVCNYAECLVAVSTAMTQPFRRKLFGRQKSVGLMVFDHKTQNHYFAVPQRLLIQNSF